MLKRETLLPDGNAKKKFNIIDTFALIFLAVFAVYYAIAFSSGVGVIDEGFYYTIAHRLTMGDAMLTQEWHLSQLSVFFQLLPVKLFVTVTGGTEGLILFMRYVFLGCWLSVGSAVYCCLRRYGLAALAGAVLFTAVIPLNVPAIGYYAAEVMLLALFCCIFFFREKERLSAPAIIAGGIVLSCIVLTDPLITFLFIFYSAAVFLRFFTRKKRKNTGGGPADLFSLRTWGFMTCGVLISMAVVFSFILSRADIASVIKILPELFTDSEYDFSFSGDLWSSNTRSVLSPALLIKAVRALGGIRLAVFAVLCAAALLIKKLPAAVKRSLLAAASVLLIWMTVSYYSGDPSGVRNITCMNVPVLCFGFLCFCFVNERNKYFDAAFVFVLCCTLLKDVSSEITLSVPSSAGLPAVMICFFRLCRETAKATGKKEENKRSFGLSRAAVLPCALSLAAIIGVTGISTAKLPDMFEDLFYYIDGYSMDTVLRSGPLKGIRTDRRIGMLYDTLMADLDKIRSESTGPVYVPSLNSWYYLALDRPYGTYTTWYVEEDLGTRQLRYWELYPEKRPEYIYISKIDRETLRSDPKKAEQKLAFFRSLCDCEVTESTVAFTVKVLSWKNTN